MNSLYYPVSGPLPYESILSIFLKVSHVNFLSPHSLGLKLEMAGDTLRAARRLLIPGMLKVLGPLIPNIEEHSPWTYSPPENLRDPLVELAFCPACIKFGYHSVFHSVKHHYFCVLHKCRLHLACQTCLGQYLQGYRLDMEIPSIMNRCSECGFENVEMFKELRMRAGDQLVDAVRHYGDLQGAWYREIKAARDADWDYAKHYYRSPISRQNLTGPFEKALEIKSPDTLAKALQDDQPVVWMYHPGFNETRKDPSTLTFRTQSIEAACLDIERRYLSRHATCVQSTNALTDYVDGRRRVAKLCPVALAYILLRIKLGYTVWPSPGSISALKSDFQQAPTMLSIYGRSSQYKELRLIFLSILGRLQFLISKGDDFMIIGRSRTDFSPNHYAPVFFRKASYSFRVLCQDPRSAVEVYREEFGGALYVKVRARGTGQKQAMLMEQFII